MSLARGAIAPWAKTSASSPYYQQTLEALARAYRQKMTTPWKELPEDFREVVLYGSGADEISFTYDDGVRRYTTRKPFEGVITNIERRWRETESSWVTEELERYQSDQPCEACTGYRLKPQALAVKIAGLHIGQVTEMSIRDAAAWFETLPSKLTAKQNEIAGRILKEIRERLAFLNDVGLDYLTLARASGTLSAAARASASGSPRRSAQGSRACSTSSTSPPSACISATMRGSSKPSSTSAISATRSSSSSMTRTRS